VGVAVAVLLGVAVEVAVGVLVILGVAVAVGVFVATGVEVAVGVAVSTGVGVNVGVGVFVGRAAVCSMTWMVSCSAWTPSKAAKPTLAKASTATRPPSNKTVRFTFPSFGSPGSGRRQASHAFCRLCH
jgi:hypothetical protein